jgi:hypothetical protein
MTNDEEWSRAAGLVIRGSSFFRHWCLDLSHFQLGFLDGETARFEKSCRNCLIPAGGPVMIARG